MIINGLNIEIGDRLTFKSWTRDHCKEAVRVVTGFDYNDRVTVRYFGWGYFVVKDSEVISCYKPTDITAAREQGRRRGRYLAGNNHSLFGDEANKTVFRGALRLAFTDGVEQGYNDPNGIVAKAIAHQAHAIGGVL